MEALEKWLGEQLKSPLGEGLWLAAIVAVRLLLRFSSERRKRKSRTRRTSRENT